MSAEQDIEPIFSCTKSLRRYLEDHHRDLGYYNLFTGKNMGHGQHYRAMVNITDGQHQGHGQHYRAMVNITGPWSTLQGHGQHYRAMVNITGPWSTLQGHGQHYRAMVNITGPWSTLQGHGQHYRAMVNITGPWSTLQGHGQHYRAMVNITGPWSILQGHGQHYRAMVNITGPWSTLQGHGLRNNDITKVFSKMIDRLVRSSDYQKSYGWPFSFRNLVEKLEDDIQIAELYNEIYLTVYPKSSLILNEYGFARTDSRNIANKIWSIANDWTALTTGR